MTYPPPPPDRMHLQYQPAPTPQQQPAQMGPGGAYGPAQPSPGQPVPGQMPPVGLSMAKPGTVTGVQVILWTLLALSAVGNVLSILSMVEYFNPFSLIALAFAVYSAIQSLASGVQIARGRRWAWIWSLVSSILGLLLAAVALVFGIVYVDNGGAITLAVGAVLGVLYGTLLGLLCSKSARQWILMHRIQRGEVQLPGGMGGFAPGAAQGPMAQGGMATGAPERPATRPGSATAAAVASLLLAAVGAWGVYAVVTSIRDEQRLSAGMSWGDHTFTEILMRGQFLEVLAIHLSIYSFLIVAGLITAPLILKGKAGGRVFGLVWAIVAVLASAFLIWSLIDNYMIWNEFYNLPGQPNPYVGRAIRDGAAAVLAIAFLILLGVPGVRAWTPGSGSGALIVMVPMGQPQQPGPYGPPQQAPYQQYPPQQ